ncbi:MAG TPA: glycosyltransferase, partial [Gemmatimonadales bacterium]|nr:glycosyltransferase [Gemmatimonadales bacterium]
MTDQRENPPCKVTFLSTVHPHPWAPTKGTFNRSMLTALSVHATVNAIVPVPWTERIRTRQQIACPGYEVSTPTFWFLPRLAPLTLAPALDFSLGRVLPGEALPSPDVILTYWTDPDGTAALHWARRIDRPMALIVGGSDIMLLSREPRRGSRMLDTIRRADLVLAVGSRIHDRLLAAGVAEDRLRILRRGVDRSRFRPMDRGAARANLKLDPDAPTLLWVGRMMPVKGVDILLQALQNARLQGVQ